MPRTGGWAVGRLATYQFGKVGGKRHVKAAGVPMSYRLIHTNVYIDSRSMRQHDYEDGVQDRHAAEDDPNACTSGGEKSKCAQDYTRESSCTCIHGDVSKHQDGSINV